MESKSILYLLSSSSSNPMNTVKLMVYSSFWAPATMRSFSRAIKSSSFDSSKIPSTLPISIYPFGEVIYYLFCLLSMKSKPLSSNWSSGITLTFQPRPNPARSKPDTLPSLMFLLWLTVCKFDSLFFQLNMLSSPLVVSSSAYS